MLEEVAHPPSCAEKTARLAGLGIAPDVGLDRSIEPVKVYVDGVAAVRPL
jgi:hypothetical protein